MPRLCCQLMGGFARFFHQLSSSYLHVKMLCADIGCVELRNQIDYAFISDLEGGRQLVGYVPAVDVSRSGITIATGFDLGQRNESDLRRLGFAPSLVAQLRPYLGLTGLRASE